ncbi:MAG: hypothetical protein E6J89_17770 [Deltaproteobacteria bacterium]|nr:MAG: hypothetical protein E6J89_17770 [Deltaproteobacteria bacterium]
MNKPERPFHASYKYCDQPDDQEVISQLQRGEQNPKECILFHNSQEQQVWQQKYKRQDETCTSLVSEQAAKLETNPRPYNASYDGGQQ